HLADCTARRETPSPRFSCHRCQRVARPRQDVTLLIPILSTSLASRRVSRGPPTTVQASRRSSRQGTIRPPRFPLLWSVTNSTSRQRLGGGRGGTSGRGPLPPGGGRQGSFYR